MHEAWLQKQFKKFIWNPSAGEPAQRAVNLENPDQKIDGVTVAELFGGRPTKSGQHVDNDTALSFSAVWACIRIISGIPSYLPFQPYQKTEKGRRLASDHYLYHLLTKRPHPLMSRQVFMERFVRNIISWGNGYALIRREGTLQRISQFDLLKPRDVKVFREGGKVGYKVEGMEGAVAPDNIIHVPHLGDDIVGKSTISYAREDIGLEFATRDYGASIFGTGVRPPGILSTEQALTDNQRKDLREAWQQHKQQGGDAVLWAGMKYQPISIPPDDAQFIDSRKFNATTIARWFGVPSDKINDNERATFSNIEHQAIAFLQDTMTPILSKIEGEFTYKTLSEDDMYWEFNMDAYLRADSKARAEMMRTTVQNAGMSSNEWREKMNLDMRDGGDELYIQRNMIPVSMLPRLIEAELQKYTKAKAS